MADRGSGSVVQAPAPAGSSRVPAQARVPGDAIRSVRVGRQGLYDRTRALVAYEVLFQPSGNGPGEGPGERATSQVITSTFGTFGVERIAGGRPLHIGLTRSFLTGVIPIPVESTGVVIEVAASTVADGELITGLEQLREAGFEISLAGYRGQMEWSGLLDLVDHVKIEAAAHPMAALTAMAERVADLGRNLIASGIEDEATFAQVATLPFTMFQGPLLERPSVLERTTLSPTQLVCARLLGKLADPDVHVVRLESTIGADPGLVLRLLRTANSASFAPNHEVTSLRQALVIIGPRRLRSWIMLMMLEGPCAASPADGLWKVLARACACRALAPATAADLAFTVGLLSGAAELLGAPAELVAESAGVGTAVQEALAGGEGIAGRILAAVRAHELDDEAGVRASGLTTYDVSQIYLSALSDALLLVQEIAGPVRG